MIPIPSPETKKWSQLNSGDLLGSIFSTRNISFDQQGYLTLAQKAMALFTDAGGNLGEVLAIVYAPDTALLGYHIVTSTGIFLLLSDLSSATLNVTSGVPLPGTTGDGCYFNNLIYVSASTAIKTWNGTAWTSVITSLTAGAYHSMTVFESLNYLSVADANTVKLYNTSNSLQATLTIPSQYQVTWMVYRASNLYIGTKNLASGAAKMFVWNGTGTAAQAAYGIDAEWMFSGCEYDNSIAVVSSNGQVLRFNGGGFDEICNFPIYNRNRKWTDGTSSPVTRRASIASGKKLYINISGNVAEFPYYLLNQPSGLWCYDPNIGLYHKSGHSGNVLIGTSNNVSSVNTTTNVFTMATAFETQTGEIVLTNANGGNIGGLDANTVYFAIRVSSTTLKLARTYADAIAGTEVDITSSGSSVAILTPKRSDFGNSASQGGAIALIVNASASISFYGNGLLFGAATVSEDSSLTTFNTLQVLTPTSENRGVVTFSKAMSLGRKDMWQTINAKMRGLFNPNDKLVFKYKILERQNLPKVSQSGNPVSRQDVNWVSTTQFQTNPFGTGVGNLGFDALQIGDEVTFILGAAAGYTAHITAISGSYGAGAGQFTITLDETFPLISSGDKSMIIVDNFTKVDFLLNTDDLQKQFPVALASKWFQMKVELRGNEVQMEELQIVNKTHLPS